LLKTDRREGEEGTRRKGRAKRDGRAASGHFKKKKGIVPEKNKVLTQARY